MIVFLNYQGCEEWQHLYYFERSSFSSGKVTFSHSGCIIKAILGTLVLWVRRAARRLRGELGEMAVRRCAVPRGPAGYLGNPARSLRCLRGCVWNDGRGVCSRCLMRSVWRALVFVSRGGPPLCSADQPLTMSSGCLRGKGVKMEK